MYLYPYRQGCILVLCVCNSKMCVRNVIVCAYYYGQLGYIIVTLTLYKIVLS